MFAFCQVEAAPGALLARWWLQQQPLNAAVVAAAAAAACVSASPAVYDVTAWELASVPAQALRAACWVEGYLRRVGLLLYCMA
jgi:hypothetical protein